MKHTLLIKTVCLVLFTVILSAALTALVFRYAGIKKYGELKTKELMCIRDRYRAARQT